MAPRPPGESSRGPAVFDVTAGVVAASTVFVLLRAISCLAIVRKISCSDYFMLLAWLLAVGLSFSICFGTTRGLGNYDVDIKPEWKPSLTRLEYVFSVLYNPCLMATKTSILAFYLNVCKVQTTFRWASIATLVVVNCAGLALTFLNIFQCSPTENVFADPLPSSTRCTDIVTLYLSSAPVNIITDLAILFLPMPILTGMNLPRKQKTILVITFALGGFVAIVDVVRIAYLQQASIARLKDPHLTKSRIAGRDDFAYYASLSYMWSAVEVNVGIICACIPTLKQLIMRVLPRMIHDVDELNSQAAADTNGGNNGSRDAAVALEGKSGFNYIDSHAKTWNGEPSKPVVVTVAQRSSSCPSAASTAVSPKPPVELDMMEFLTTPDMTELPARARRVDTTARSGTATSPFYDFVNPNGPRSMINLPFRKSWFPVAMVTTLFFLWGFAYGLLASLNMQFQRVIGLDVGQQTCLHSAYWAGYFVAPLTVGRFMLKGWGFKATFITGLCIYACGTLIFWPSAVLGSFPAFFVSNFVVGFGLATLEVAANPFICLCGPARYAEARLNFAQAFQAVGGVVSPIVATLVVFREVGDAPSLIDAQWVYLAIAFFDIALAVVFYYLPLPEASDEALESLRNEEDGQVFGFSVLFVTLGIGVMAQFCYVGAQEAVATAFAKYVAYIKSRTNPLNSFTASNISHSCFMIGRFMAAVVSMFVKPRHMLVFFYLGAVITCGLTMTLEKESAVAAAMLVFFFESAIWPLIFAISLRGMGSHTKTASGFLTSAAASGGVFPPVNYAIYLTRGIQFSQIVGVVLLSVGCLFPIYLNVVPAAKKQVDHVKARDEPHLSFHSARPRSERSAPLSPRSRPASVASGRSVRSERSTGSGTSGRAARPKTMSEMSALPWRGDSGGFVRNGHFSV